MRNWNVARAQVKLRLAAEQLSDGNIEAAANEVAEAGRLDPNLPNLVVLQARVWLAKGELDRAADLLEQAQARSAAPITVATPDSVEIATPTAPQPEVAYLLGVVRQQQQRWAEAAAAFAQARELDPREVAYLVATVQAQLQLGNPRAAVELLLAASPQFSWTAAYQAALAECREQLDNWAGAAAAWQRVVDARGAAPDIRERLAHALCRAGQHADAIPVLQELLAVTPPELQDAARLLLAEAYLAGGQPTAAREQTQLVLRGTPQHPEALRLLALAHGAAGDHTAALRSAQRALAADPDHVPTAELVAALAWRTGQRDLAVATARALAQRDAQNAVAIQLLASAAAGAAGQ